ncbi:hypothetical protein FBU30_008606 [Linnemannia zychae]|nr:hypothetical protein FBU30_008606 [Linnemannia zychae]
MRVAQISSFTLSLLVIFVTLFQAQVASASSTTSDDTHNNSARNDLGIDLRRRRHLYRAIEHFYASVENDKLSKHKFSNQNIDKRAKKASKRELLNDVLGGIVPNAGKIGSESIEVPSKTLATGDIATVASDTAMEATNTASHTSTSDALPPPSVSVNDVTASGTDPSFTSATTTVTLPTDGDDGRPPISPADTLTPPNRTTPDPTSAGANTSESPITTALPVSPSAPSVDPVPPTTTPPTSDSVPPSTTTEPTVSPPTTTEPTVPPTTEPTTPPTTTDPTTPPPTTEPTIPPTTIEPTTPPPTTEPTVPPTTEPTTEPTSKTKSTSKTKPTTSSSSSRGGHTKTDSDHATSTSNNVVKPSDTSSSGGETSSSNKAAVTIGVVVGAVVICGGIGVWVFRKWKLSPSRQFKSKIRSSATVGSLTGGGAAAVIGGGDDDYDGYSDLFRSQAHDSAVSGPVMASSMAPAVSVAGSSSPHHQQQPLPQSQSQYDLGMYDQGPVQGQGHSPIHQHVSMSNVSAATTVPDYSQYRYAPSGHESGIPESILTTGAGYHQGGGGYYQQHGQNPYSSMYSDGQMYHTEGSVASNGRSTGQFLRELRE